MRQTVLPFVFLLLTGCPTNPDGSDTGPVSFPDCEAIIEACHDVDPGTGPAHDCHEAAHDAASNTDCAPLRASCVATCTAIDGGVPEDAAHGH